MSRKTKNYTIHDSQKWVRGTHTLLEVTLNKDNQWCRATSTSRSFTNLKAARRWWADNGLKIGGRNKPYILGPRDGHHWT